MTGLERGDADSDAGKRYAVLVADTVVVKPGGAPPDVATALAPRDWKDVAYFLKVCGGCRGWGGGGGLGSRMRPGPAACQAAPLLLAGTRCRCPR